MKRSFGSLAGWVHVSDGGGNLYQAAADQEHPPKSLKITRLGGPRRYAWKALHRNYNARVVHGKSTLDRRVLRSRRDVEHWGFFRTRDVSLRVPVDVRAPEADNRSEPPAVPLKVPACAQGDWSELRRIRVVAATSRLHLGPGRLEPSSPGPFPLCLPEASGTKRARDVLHLSSRSCSSRIRLVYRELIR